MHIQQVLKVHNITYRNLMQNHLFELDINKSSIHVEQYQQKVDGGYTGFHQVGRGNLLSKKHCIPPPDKRGKQD